MDEINLNQIIEQFPDCLINGEKLKTILFDLYPDIPKSIVNTLVIIVNSGIAKEIQVLPQITEENKFYWKKQIVNDYAILENTVDFCLNLFYKAIFSDSLDCASDDDFDIDNDVFEGDGFLGKYHGNATIVLVPNKAKIIGKYAFSNNDNIKKIIVSESVIQINSYAFCECSNLISVYIPASVSLIESMAFFCCKNLCNISISNENKWYYSKNNCIIKRDTNEIILGCNNSYFSNEMNIEAIGWHAFHCCRELKKITIPDSVTKIDDYAFWGCSELSEVVIGKGVISIGKYAFV